jgi:osmotically-inducible protein OsmY
VENRLEVKGEKAEANSDSWIATKVKTSLWFHRSVSSQTDVDVKDGIVTLNGPASSQAQKDLTAEYAEDVEGVTSVNNQMTLGEKSSDDGQTLGEQIDDASITAQVKLVLASHRSTSALRTKTETRDGVVTLSGEAANQAEKDLVSKLTRDINGVKSVNNNMTVKV